MGLQRTKSGLEKIEVRNKLHGMDWKKFCLENGINRGECYQFMRGKRNSHEDLFNNIKTSLDGEVIINAKTAGVI